MPLQLPKGFIAIKDATQADATVSLIGILVSYDAPRSTRKDFALDFTIQDDFTSGDVGGQSSIGCRLFRATQDKFPKISGVGDVIILRNFKLSLFNLRPTAVGMRMSSMLVFPSNGIPVPELSLAYQAGSQKLPHANTGSLSPTIPEQMAVIHLKHASTSAAPQVQQHAAVSASKTRTSKRDTLIKDLMLETFCNIRAQVVSIYDYSMGGPVDLKVTDYTPNDLMFHHPEPDQGGDYMVTNNGWKGPYGYLTLNVTLYGVNATWAEQNLANGDYVFIRNMKVKLSRDGKLEGMLHEDPKYTSKVDILRLENTTDIEQIDKRREEYEKKRENKTALQTLQNPKNMSGKTTREKKQAKKERQRAEKQAEQEDLEKQEREWERTRGGVNANVIGAFPNMKLSTISEIIHNPHREMQTPEKYNTYTLPFINCRHRSRVRAVDVYPPELELFAHSTRDGKWNKKHAKRQSSTSNPAKERWEWGFVLLLEDANISRDTVSEKLRVVVNNEAGQYLLGMNAQDLRNQPRALKQLEEKLFILWGNLMELKTELRDRGTDLPLPPGDNRLQNKPFDACIEEYGAEVPMTDEHHPFGYQRMHKLSLTKIQD